MPPHAPWLVQRFALAGLLPLKLLDGVANALPDRHALRVILGEQGVRALTGRKPGGIADGAKDTR